MSAFPLPRAQRLTGKSDLERVRREGKRVRAAHLEVWVGGLALCRWRRVGFIVREHGQNSV
ncbi:MAG: hypothetical protein U5K74_10790 [Gemmatimonadaceae bacterium]|nr:hypothetical protein [Gemmatimonadaceae bacterium]